MWKSKVQGKANWLPEQAFQVVLLHLTGSMISA
jgi:hypothetical protein